MGGQNNLPADTGRSDLRTWEGGAEAERGPGPRGGRVVGGGEEKGTIKGRNLTDRRVRLQCLLLR